MIQAICWVLVHSLWQGVLLALAGGGVILCTKRSAAVRYRWLCGLTIFFLGAVGLTFFYEWGMVSDGGEGSAGAGVVISWLGDWCSVHAYPIVGIWLGVAAIKSLRMAAGWSYVRRMRRDGLAAPPLWEEKVEVLSRALGIRRGVKLVESALVRVPVVIGQLKPIIYIPLGLINHLPASEMEAVVLHELAHIRRYDHVVNMVQQAAECVLFFNPGFLWVSALLREERENCCDDIAIAHTLDRVEFVRALVRFKEHSLMGMGLAFPGNRRQLLHRVLRISRQENRTLSGKERLVLLGGCVLVLCLLAARVGKADSKKMERQEIVAKVKGVKVVEAGAVSQAQVSQERPVQPELLSVLQTREQVAQNMEWVQAQLSRLHRKATRKNNVSMKGSPAERDRETLRQNEERDRLNLEQAAGDKKQAAQDKEQVRQKGEEDRLNLEQKERDRQQAVRDLEQAERDREQAERDRQQAEKDRQQAMRDLEQAERDRMQAEKDRQQADQQGERDRQKAEKDRTEKARNREQADRNRAQADQNRNKSNNTNK